MASHPSANAGKPARKRNARPSHALPQDGKTAQEAIMPASRPHHRDKASWTATPVEAKLKPGHAAAPGTPGTGEVYCPECHGRGRVDGVRCQMCGGTGKVTRAIGGA